MAKFFADNKTGAAMAFYHRKKYKDEAFGISRDAALDFWYTGDIRLYGRFDTSANAVFPSENYMKQVSEGQFLLNFVADAFDDFKNSIRRGISAGALCSPSFLDGLTVVGGFESSATEHHSYMEKIYEAFAGTFMTTQSRKKEVTSYSSYLKVFRRFVEIMVDEMPLSRSGFIESIYCSPLSTGLVIDTKDEDHSDDLLKERDFLEHSNFPYYMNTARAHGFLLDKNAPWRLIFDITSPEARGYMRSNGINSIDEMFDVCYYKAYRLDVDIMKEYVRGFYNSYVLGAPRSMVIDERRRNLQREVTRDTVTDKEFNATSEIYWLRLYSFIRSQEMKINWTDVELNIKAKKAEQIRKHLNYGSSLEYINNELKSSRARVIIDVAQKMSEAKKTAENLKAGREAEGKAKGY